MGLGWHVALERGLPTEAIAPADGKALIFYQHQLDEAADALGVPPLTRFVSAMPEKVAAYLRQQGLDPEQFALEEEAWFPAAEGLATVRGLLSNLSAAPASVTDPVRLVRALQAIEGILIVAEREQVRFHLTSDLPDTLA